MYREKTHINEQRIKKKKIMMEDTCKKKTFVRIDLCNYFPIPLLLLLLILVSILGFIGR